MIPADVQQYVHSLLVDEFEVDEGVLSPEARLVDDLELDSLDAVDLIVALEKKFGCRIEEEQARSMATLNDVYEFIRRTCETSHTASST